MRLSRYEVSPYQRESEGWTPSSCGSTWIGRLLLRPELAGGETSPVTRQSQLNHGPTQKAKGAVGRPWPEIMTSGLS